jgi:hypothetical protein
LFDGEDQRSPFGVRVADEIKGVEGGKQPGILLNVEDHVALEVDGAGDIVTVVKDDPSAAVRGGEVDGGLQTGCVESDSVRLCTEIAGEVVSGSECTALAREKQESQ